MSIAAKCTCHMSPNGFCNASVKQCTKLIKMEEKKYPIDDWSNYLPMMSNVQDRTGISIEWQKLWSEVENWYGDVKKRESGEQFLKRMQATYFTHAKACETSTIAAIPKSYQDGYTEGWDACRKGQYGAVWVKGQYDRLYDQVKGGKRTVCYVDYNWSVSTLVEPVRDICTIKPGQMELSSRGHCYGSYRDWTALEGLPEKEAFIKMCEDSKVEWLDEGTAAGREEDAVAFARWILELNYKPYNGEWYLNGNHVTHHPRSTNMLYQEFKQQKEK